MDSVVGGRDNRIATGEEITPELIDWYSDYFKHYGFTAETVQILSNTLGFYRIDASPLTGSAYVDYWAEMQNKQRINNTK